MIPFSIDPDIRQAQTPPSAWYRDQPTYDAVITNVFANTWQFVATESELTPHGVTESKSARMLPTSILPGSLNEPIVVVREGAETRVLSNVCTHRGNILVRQACTLREIRCQYHGRRFGTDGKLQHMPEFKDVDGFPADSDNLGVLDHGRWSGMHFARMHPSTDPLPNDVTFDAWSANLRDRLSFLPLLLAEHRVERDRDFAVHAHWALYVENYLEGFHIPFVHPGLNAVLEWNAGETLCLEHGVLQIGIAREGDVTFNLPADHLDYGKRVAAYYYWMFPNTMINVYPWGISLNIILPQSRERTLVRYRTFVWDDSIFNTGAGSSLDTVEQEDDDVVEHQQRGMQSRLYDRGRYSPKHEQGVHHFHRMLELSLVDNRSNPRLKR